MLAVCTIYHFPYSHFQSYTQYIVESCTIFSLIISAFWLCCQTHSYNVIIYIVKDKIFAILFFVFCIVIYFLFILYCYFCIILHYYYNANNAYFALNTYFLIIYTVFLIFILVIAVEIVAYILTYIGISFRLTNNLIPIRYKSTLPLYLYSHLFFLSFCIIYIYSVSYNVRSQWCIFTIIIYLHNLMMFKEDEETKESK